MDKNIFATTTDTYVPEFNFLPFENSHTYWNSGTDGVVNVPSLRNVKHIKCYFKGKLVKKIHIRSKKFYDKKTKLRLPDIITDSVEFTIRNKY